jgi:BlaI family transcriptional regulator, penicillinase repressor
MPADGVNYVGRAAAKSLASQANVLHTVTHTHGQGPRAKSERSVHVEDALPDLSDLEGEVMQIIWIEGPLTADVVRAKLKRRLTDSTIRTVLRRLEEKGYVNHALEGRAFLYQAAEPRRRVAARAVKRIIEWFCSGSTEELLLGMVDHAMLDPGQLQMLAEKVKRAKRNNAGIEKNVRTSGRKRGPRGAS